MSPPETKTTLSSCQNINILSLLIRFCHQRDLNFVSGLRCCCFARSPCLWPHWASVWVRVRTTGWAVTFGREVRCFSSAHPSGEDTVSEDCLRERERARAELFLPSWLSHFRAEVQTRCFRKKTNKTKKHTQRCQCLKWSVCSVVFCLLFVMQSQRCFCNNYSMRHKLKAVMMHPGKRSNNRPGW